MQEKIQRTQKEWIFFLILASFLFISPLFVGPLYESIRNRNVYLLDQTPYFDGASPEANLLGVVEKPESYRTMEWKNIPYLPAEFNNGHWFPGEYLLTFYRIQRNDGNTVWVSPDLIVIDGKTEVYTVSQIRHLPAAVSSLLGILLIVLFGFPILRDSFSAGGQGSTGALALVLYLLLFLKQFLLAAWLYFGSSMQIHLVDEISYFRIAYEIFHGVSSPWNYTVGYPLLISPLLAMTGISPDGMQRAAELISACNGYLILPLCTAMLGLILYHFSNSLRRTFYILCAFLTIPFLISPYENFPLHFFSIWIDMPWFYLSYKSYYTQIWAGWNALSDPSSTFFVMLCILLGIFRSRGLLRMVFISALFAFACLIRINNIFFAPLIAFLFWKGNRDLFLKNRFVVLRDTICCLAAFFCIFLIQLLINQRDFSSPFVWPYILHDTASQGFRLTPLLNGGMDYFVKCNLLLFAFGTAAILFIREEKLRILFILWVFPLTIFFSGYVCFSASPIRFILPSLFGLAAAIGCGEFWNMSWNRRTCLYVFVLFVMMILAYNPYVHGMAAEFLYRNTLPQAYLNAWFWIRMILLGVCLAAVLPGFLRKITMPYCCWICAFTLYFSSSGILLWGLSVLLSIYGIVLFCKDVCTGLFFMKKSSIR